MQQPLSLSFEPKPRDFCARLRRARPSRITRARGKRHRGRRAVLLFSAVALPAFAAPEEWSAVSQGDPVGVVQAEGLPFERAGESFPGSAFYFLQQDASPSGEVSPNPLLASSNPTAGPAAGAMRVAFGGVDRTRALQCLTAAIYYEAASEPDDGQQAVAQVVLNRVAHPAYPNTVCGVVYQGSERSTGCQFTFTCDGSLARAPSRFFWLRAEAVARAALAGSVYAPVGLATHYHTVQIHPYWADSLVNVGTIGAHRFYRFGGGAGRPGVFRFVYGGGEPIAAPHPRSSTAPVDGPLLDPRALQRLYDTPAVAAQAPAPFPASARLAPAPLYAPAVQNLGGDAIYRGDRLPGSGVRPEFEASGRWIASPGA